jgi:hypothetical protein
MLEEFLLNSQNAFEYFTNCIPFMNHDLKELTIQFMKDLFPFIKKMPKEDINFDFHWITILLTSLLSKAGNARCDFIGKFIF